MRATGQASGHVLAAAGDLAKQSEVLRAEVAKFLTNVRAAYRQAAPPVLALSSRPGQTARAWMTLGPAVTVGERLRFRLPAKIVLTLTVAFKRISRLTRP